MAPKNKMLSPPAPKPSTDQSPKLGAKPDTNGNTGGKLTPGTERHYQAKDALSTLMRAEEHKRNKPLMRDVKRVAADGMKAMASVTGKK